MLTVSNCQDILKNIIGYRMILAQYVVHKYGDIISIISVKMFFEGDSFISVQCASDGESLRIGQDVHSMGYLGEFGRLELVGVDELDPAYLRLCIGNAVKRVTVEAQADVPKSMRMECGDHNLFFSNIGDELNFEEARFEQMISEEQWEALTPVTFLSE